VEMTDWMSHSWKLLVTRGAIAVVFGLVALFWPVGTAVALAILWGIWALVDGISSISQAFTPEGSEGRVWLVLMGVVALLAGFFAVTSPGIAAVALTWILGIWLIVRAGFEVFGAFSSSRTAPRWLMLLGAAASLALGILFAANPGGSVVALAEVLGVLALFWGVVFIGIGLAMRGDLRAADKGKVAPT
jgi:uncharacterized membrane protein HdeD (DUF308 family)